jgi:pimeloyl-ACP methyl ester carboxylesterase
MRARDGLAGSPGTCRTVADIEILGFVTDPIDDLSYLDRLDSDEFAHLEAEARGLGVDVHVSVERVSLTDEISGLRWGEGPADVVLLHGAALNAHTWDGTLLRWSATSPGRGFLALDLPGHGDSPWRDDADYAPATLAGPVADALATATARGLLSDEYVLVGHSLGGLTGIELTSRDVPLRHLVLVDILPLPPEVAGTVASFLDGPTSFASRAEIVDRALAFGLGGGRGRVERGVALNTRIADDGRVVWKHHFGRLGGSALRVGDSDVTWLAIEQSTVPIDLVAAQMSFIGAASVDTFLNRRLGGRATRLAGGHNLQEDSPVALADTLAGLLATGG